MEQIFGSDPLNVHVAEPKPEPVVFKKKAVAYKASSMSLEDVDFSDQEVKKKRKKPIIKLV